MGESKLAVLVFAPRIDVISAIFCRLNEAQQQAEEMRSMFEARDGRMRQEVELARQECEAQTNMAMQMRIECENLRNELSSMHMHSKQSSELIRRSEDGSCMHYYIIISVKRI